MASQGSRPLEALALSIGATRSGFVHLLVDQSALPNIGSLWPAIRAGTWAPVLGTLHDQPDGGSPLLIDVSQASKGGRVSDLVHRLYEQGRFATCLSLLESGLDSEQLAEALRLRCDAELPDRLAVVLRYFDTRTLPLLPQMLTADQYASFMNCVDSWHFVDRAGHVQSMPAALERTAGAYPSPLVLDPTQERMLIDDGLVDAVIDQLLDHRHPALGGMAPPDQFDRVSGLVNAARRYGIDDIAEALMYCFAAFEHGEDFDSREPWSERLVMHRRGAISLETALQHG